MFFNSIISVSLSQGHSNVIRMTILILIKFILMTIMALPPVANTVLLCSCFVPPSPSFCLPCRLSFSEAHIGLLELLHPYSQRTRSF